MRLQTTFSAILGAACLMSVSPAESSIYTIYSDKGMSGTNMYTWTGGSFAQTVPSIPVPPEGFGTLQTTCGAWCGWGIFYHASLYPAGINLSAYQSGELRFWLRTTSTDMKVDIEQVDGAKFTVSLTPQITALNQWVLIRVPLATVPLATLTQCFSPFEISANSGVIFYVDAVRYVDSTTPLNSFKVNAHVVGTGASHAGDLSFNSASPGNWVLADQYLSIEVDPSVLNWGVQIYTDNTLPTASPQFVPAPGVVVGEPGSNPAGLVDMSNNSRRLPLAWKIQANTAAAPSTFDPGWQVGDPPAGFGWHYVADQATPKIVKENTDAFVNGMSYAVVENYKGIHFGPGPADDQFGAENPAHHLYLEGDFRVAATPNSYQTSTLTIEYFIY